MKKEDAIKKLDELFGTLILKYELIDKKCREIENKIKAYRKRNRQRMREAKTRWRIIRKQLQDKDETFFQMIK